jgi:hypothetical protein
VSIELIDNKSSTLIDRWVILLFVISVRKRNSCNQVVEPSTYEEAINPGLLPNLSSLSMMESPLPLFQFQ